jgi:hypothetical protein
MHLYSGHKISGSHSRRPAFGPVRAGRCATVLGNASTRLRSAASVTLPKSVRPCRSRDVSEPRRVGAATVSERFRSQIPKTDKHFRRAAIPACPELQETSTW